MAGLMLSTNIHSVVSVPTSWARLKVVCALCRRYQATALTRKAAKCLIPKADEDAIGVVFAPGNVLQTPYHFQILKK